MCAFVHNRRRWEEDVAVRIGAAIRTARETQELRQDELALAAGVSRRLLVAVETGKPTAQLDGVLRILAALGLTLEVAPRRRLPDNGR